MFLIRPARRQAKFVIVEAIAGQFIPGWPQVLECHARERTGRRSPGREDLHVYEVSLVHLSNSVCDLFYQRVVSPEFPGLRLV